MDKSAFPDVGNLQGDQGVPERRVVRTDIADAAFSIIDWRQHRGRQWPQVGWGTHAVSTHRTRLSCGAGYHLLLARDLELLSDTTHSLLVKQTDEVQRMLTSLIQQVQPVQLVKKAAAR